MTSKAILRNLEAILCTCKIICSNLRFIDSVNQEMKKAELIKYNFYLNCKWLHPVSRCFLFLKKKLTFWKGFPVFFASHAWWTIFKTQHSEKREIPTGQPLVENKVVSRCLLLQCTKFLGFSEGTQTLETFKVPAGKSLVRRYRV